VGKRLKSTAVSDDDELDGDWHPSQETANRFPTDQLLRLEGFAIYSRPKRGKDLWVKKGKHYTYEQAIHSVSEA
jgi:hypothetical protein